MALFGIRKFKNARVKEETNSLDKLKKAELTGMLDEMEVEYDEKMKKDELIELVKENS